MAKFFNPGFFWLENLAKILPFLPYFSHIFYAEIRRKTAKNVPRQISGKIQRYKYFYVQALIDRIPTDRGPLFAYPMVWENLTSDLMKNRISPWVQKKLKEIIGEDEPTLVQFISEKLDAESKPENILSEIRVVLGKLISEFFLQQNFCNFLHQKFIFSYTKNLFFTLKFLHSLHDFFHIEIFAFSYTKN